MPRYIVTGKGKNSGRSRKRMYTATSAEEATERAVADGTVPDQVEELSPDPPTDRQVEYAHDLGLKVPDGATKRDVSDMLSCKLDGDRPSSARHRGFARLYGVEVTEYIGKKALFDDIKAALDVPGREQELAAWFVYRVYRAFVHGADNAPIKGPDDSLVEEIAIELARDSRVISSIRRYEGRSLIWFGEWTAPDGFTYTGGSKRTIAYRAAATALRRKTGLPEPSSRTRTSTLRAPLSGQHSKSGLGCSTIAFAALFVLLIAAFISALSSTS